LYPTALLVDSGGQLIFSSQIDQVFKKISTFPDTQRLVLACNFTVIYPKIGSAAGQNRLVGKSLMSTRERPKKDPFILYRKYQK
jgi:hypothetical protein